MENRQTAVEWLEKQLTDAPYIHFGDLFEQAKEMEKQQIKDAWNNGAYCGDMINIENSQDYFVETYGSKGSDENFKQFSLYEHKETIATADTPTSSQTEIEKLASKHYPEYYSIGLGNDRIGFERGYNLGKSSQTEISDEEIEKEASKSAINYSTKRTYPEIRHLAYSNGFLEGIKWYREQLKTNQ